MLRDEIKKIVGEAIKDGYDLGFKKALLCIAGMGWMNSPIGHLKQPQADAYVKHCNKLLEKSDYSYLITADGMKLLDKKDIPKLPVGDDEGQTCNRDGCDGSLEYESPENCTCHVNPPCSACTDVSIYCPKCGWGMRDDN
jgi:hypothetical protein